MRLLTIARVIHRQDYHAILLHEAERLGAEIKLNADVANLDFEKTEAILADGTVFKGDVIVGADGMWISAWPLPDTDIDTRRIVVFDARRHSRTSVTSG